LVGIKFVVFCDQMTENTPTLSEKERVWIRLLIQGKNTEEVAREAEIPKGTLAHSLRLVRERFGCRNTIALVAHLIKNNLIETELVS